MNALIWPLQLASTWAMVGLIWLIQIVHYPLFSQVGEEQFPLYSEKHSQRISLVVGPLMLCEFVSAFLLWRQHPGLLESLGLFAVALLWVITGLVFAPLHSRLAKGFDKKAHQRLLRANWLRTAIWTGRGVLVLFFTV